ncbi:MAG: hypothetical protein U0165_09250 [Polyangiaceae bacterium]
MIQRIMGEPFAHPTRSAHQATIAVYSKVFRVFIHSGHGTCGARDEIMTLSSSLSLLPAPDRVLIRCVISAMPSSTPLREAVLKLLSGRGVNDPSHSYEEALARVVLWDGSLELWKAVTRARPWQSTPACRGWVAELISAMMREELIEEDNVLMALPDEAVTRALRGTELKLVMACMSSEVPFLKLVKAIVSVEALLHRLPPLLLWSSIVLEKLAPRALVECISSGLEGSSTVIRARPLLDTRPVTSTLADDEEDPTLKWSKRSQSGVELRVSSG